jgi:tmRNA-binding protein
MEKADILMRPSSEFANVLAAPSAAEIDELAERSESLEQRVVSLNDSYETLKKREVELTEWRWVLRETGSFFDRVCRRPCFVFRRLLILTHRHIRHTVIQKKSGHLSTATGMAMVMKPRCCKTSNTVARTVIPKVNLSPL